MKFVIGLGLASLAFWAFHKLRMKWADEALDAQLQSSFREARTTLSLEDLKRLTAQLNELRASTIHAAYTHGLNGKQATRMGKTAAIQSIGAFIEIDRMFESKG